MIESWWCAIVAAVSFFAGMAFQNGLKEMRLTSSDEINRQWNEYLNAVGVDENGCPPCDNGGGFECADGPMPICKQQFIVGKR